MTDKIHDDREEDYLCPRNEIKHNHLHVWNRQETAGSIQTGCHLAAQSRPQRSTFCTEESLQTSCSRRSPRPLLGCCNWRKARRSDSISRSSAELLPFGMFDQFQNILHLIERLAQGFDNLHHFVHGLADG